MHTMPRGLMQRELGDADLMTGRHNRKQKMRGGGLVLTMAEWCDDADETG